MHSVFRYSTSYARRKIGQRVQFTFSYKIWYKKNCCDIHTHNNHSQTDTQSHINTCTGTCMQEQKSTQNEKRNKKKEHNIDDDGSGCWMPSFQWNNAHRRKSYVSHMFNFNMCTATAYEHPSHSISFSEECTVLCICQLINISHTIQNGHPRTERSILLQFRIFCGTHMCGIWIWNYNKIITIVVGVWRARIYSMSVSIFCSFSTVAK